MKKKGSKGAEMSIMDAVDNLSSMAELDVETEEVGVKRSLQSFKNLKQKDREETLGTVKATFKTVHKYLQHIYQKDPNHLQDIEMQKSVKAIMILAGEAAEKLGQYTSLFQHTYQEGKITEIKEYEDLKKFYTQKIVKRFKEALIAEERWEEEWGGEGNVLQIEKLGLKDLEMVKRDRNYELFYIRQDDGKPFFNRNLLRHIKLVSDFDEIVSTTEGEDPLLQVNVLTDQELQTAADEIRHEVKEELGEFYIEALRHQEVPIIRDLNKVTMSLLLASNARNLLKHTSGKTCTRYFQDFQKHLRGVLASEDYTRLLAHLKETDHLSRSLVKLIHAYSYAFFMHVGNRRGLIHYINDLVEKGFREEKAKQKEIGEPILFWNHLFETHDAVASTLKRYPSGPLFKTLDTFREREAKEEGFDPIFQGNYPSYSYTLSSESFDSKLLRLPCPTFHDHINHAIVIEEFKGYLRYLESKKEIGKHLLFNLQDRTSWEEHARCEALEGLQKNAEFSKQLVLVTLPKQGDFYHQTNVYKKVDHAADFIKLIQEQFNLGEECGFYFSQNLQKSELEGFIKKVLPLIHSRIFEKKGQLSRQERLDFIEIFYGLLMLKILDLVKPGHFTFTCKDAVDTGPATAGSFYAMIKMMSSCKTYSKDEQDYFLCMLYGPALMVRERLIDYHILSRAISAVSSFYEGFKKDEKGFLKALEPLFDYPLFQKLQLKFET